MTSLFIRLNISIVVLLVSAVAFFVASFYVCRFFYRRLTQWLLKSDVEPIDKDKAVKVVEKPTWFFSTMLKHFCKVPFFRRQFQECSLPIARYITKALEQVETEIKNDPRGQS